jgi:hypothetical protein
MTQEMTERAFDYLLVMSLVGRILSSSSEFMLPQDDDDSRRLSMLLSLNSALYIRVRGPVTTTSTNYFASLATDGE